MTATTRPPGPAGTNPARKEGPPLCIVQARMDSRRLPGKVLRGCAGKPLLLHLIERLRTCRHLSGIVVATSGRPDDDPIAKFCADAGVLCHRGPKDDVAGRFLEAIERYGADSFVRISGDSPLLDPALVDRASSLFSAGDWDVVSNIQQRTYPKGQSVEVVGAAAFAAACGDMTAPADREHVTPFLYRNPDRFRIHGFRHERPLGHLQLSVDTIEDFQRVEALIARMSRPPETYGLEDLLALADGMVTS